MFFGFHYDYAKRLVCSRSFSLVRLALDKRFIFFALPSAGELQCILILSTSTACNSCKAEDTHHAKRRRFSGDFAYQALGHNETDLPPGVANIPWPTAAGKDDEPMISKKLSVRGMSALTFHVMLENRKDSNENI